ncbi:MAG: hypothetical protein ACOYLS_10695 [Polymorphobacter sp.]
MTTALPGAALRTAPFDSLELRFDLAKCGLGNATTGLAFAASRGAARQREAVAACLSMAQPSLISR